MNLRPYLDWFDAHVDGFRARLGHDARHIDYKDEHTRRVLKNAETIAAGLDLPPRLAGLVRLAALLHDVGRFRQFEEYGTFFDAASANHGLLGVRELKGAGILDALPAQDRRTVLTAVALHNRYRLPPSLPGDASVVVAVVRDADKLDILRDNMLFLEEGKDPDKVLTRIYATFDQSRRGVSSAILASLEAGVLPPRSARVYANDQILILLGWVMDMHFGLTVRLLLEQGCFVRLAAHLPTDDRTSAVVASLRGMAERRASEPGWGDAASPGSPGGGSRCASGPLGR